MLVYLEKRTLTKPGMILSLAREPSTTVLDVLETNGRRSGFHHLPPRLRAAGRVHRFHRIVEQRRLEAGPQAIEDGGAHAVVGGQAAHEDAAHAARLQLVREASPLEAR